MRLRISPEEHRGRMRRAWEEARRRGLDVLVVFSPSQIFYLTGFAFIPTERPIALILADSAAVLFVPRLEEEHASTEATVDRVVAYPEYPSERHPMVRLADVFTEMGLARARVGSDAEGYPGGMGYKGPRLAEVLPEVKVLPAGDLVEDMMKIKSPAEIALIRESTRWAHLAHALLQEYTRPGVVESEAAMRASLEATLAMARALGPGFRPLSWGSPGASAGYRGQVGTQSAIPHAMTTHARIRPGDVLVSEASASVGGYSCELERTMIVAPVREEHRRYFGLMVGAQEVALEAIRPGRPCAEVDRAVRAYFERHGLMPYWRHHTGHALGIGVHEAPFLDIGDETILQPGMVFSVEPGIYIPGFAGFRHSDTIVVTESGFEMLTDYPRDLDSLTIAG